MSEQQPDAAMGFRAPGQPVRLSELLLTLHGELLALHGMADDAQAILGAAFEHAPPDAANLVRAQSLDLLTQRLQALAGFVLALAPSLPTVWHVDPTAAASRIVLADLAQRLQCSTCIEVHEPGAVEMF